LCDNIKRFKSGFLNDVPIPSSASNNIFVKKIVNFHFQFVFVCCFITQSDLTNATKLTCQLPRNILELQYAVVRKQKFNLKTKKRTSSLHCFRQVIRNSTSKIMQAVEARTAQFELENG